MQYRLRWLIGGEKLFRRATRIGLTLIPFCRSFGLYVETGAWEHRGDSGCRVHPIPSFWFGFPAYANQSFIQGRCNSIRLSRKNKTLTDHRKPLYRQNTHSNCLHDIPWNWNVWRSQKGLTPFSTRYPLHLVTWVLEYIAIPSRDHPIIRAKLKAAYHVLLSRMRHTLDLQSVYAPRIVYTSHEEYESLSTPLHVRRIGTTITWKSSKSVVLSVVAFPSFFFVLRL